LIIDEVDALYFKLVDDTEIFLTMRGTVPNP